MGGAVAVDGAGVVAVALVILVLAGASIAGRRVLLERGGGTVECGLRRPSADGSWAAWRLGVARYRHDQLSWHQILGVRMRPYEILARGSLTVVSRRRPEPQEVSSLGADTVIVRCTARTASGTTSGAEPEQQVELAMGEAAMTGFLAWLEAAPRDPYRRRLARAVTVRRPASTARRRRRCSPAGRG